MHGVRSGRTYDEVLNAPEKFSIDMVVLELGVEFTVAVQAVEIEVVDDGDARKRHVAHKAQAVMEGELRASVDHVELVYPMKLIYSKARDLTDPWIFDYAATVHLVSTGGTSAQPDHDPPVSIRTGLGQVGMLALSLVPVRNGIYPIDRIARLHRKGGQFESSGWGT